LGDIDKKSGLLDFKIESSDVPPGVAVCKVERDWVLDIDSWSVGEHYVSVTFKNPTYTLHGLEYPATVSIEKQKLKQFILDVLK